jgi:hypothetical protein
MIKDFKNAIPYFEKALSYNLAPEAEYVQMLIVSYGYSLIYSDRLTDAIAFLEQIYPLFNTYGDFVFLMGCCYIRSGEYLKAVSQFVRATTLTNYKGEGVTTYLALYNLGLLYDTLGEKDMAITFFEKAAPQYAPAQEQLERLTAQQ